MPFLKVDEEIVLKIFELDDAGILFDLVESNRSYLREWVPWVDTNVTIKDSQAFIKSS